MQKYNKYTNLPKLVLSLQKLCINKTNSTMKISSLTKVLCLFAMLLTPIYIYGQTDPLEGKSIAVIGDSYVKNHREPIANSWHAKLAAKHHMKYYNYGRNGICVSFNRAKWGLPLYISCRNMRDSLDYIVIIAGHNDAALLDSIGIDNYRARCSEVCDTLTNKYPEARIYWFTPWANDNPDFRKVVDATIDVCGEYGIPVFDSYRMSNIFARSDRFRDIYFQGGRRDHAHLNSKGHDRFLPVAEKFIMEH